MDENAPHGLSPDDLPDIAREHYLHAAELARTAHDPAAEWDAFRDRLWDALTPLIAPAVPAAGEQAGLYVLGGRDTDPREGTLPG